MGGCEIETLHGCLPGAIRSDCGVRKQMSGHTFEGEGVAEEETTAVVWGLEGRLGYFYKLCMRALVGGIRVR